MAGQTQFVNYSLTKMDKADIEAHIAQPGWVETAIESVLSAGYRVVLGRDDKQACFTAFVFPQGDDHIQSGYAISSRGSTPTKALAVVLWKHVVLYVNSWPHDNGTGKFPVDL